MFLPVKSIQADELQNRTNKLIIELEAIGFRVVVLITDGNAINKRLFTLFSPDKKLRICVPNPADSTRPLFFMFDSVHILKSIRNNWLNCSNPPLEFTYPVWEDNNRFQSANFGHLRKIGEMESSSILKVARTLTKAALHPSNIQRQNVKLALRIFAESNIVALETYGERNNFSGWQGTKSFLELVIRWWKIVNVKTPYKDTRFREADFASFKTVSDNRLTFLSELSVWIEMWRISNVSGKLSRETFESWSHTCYALKEVIEYLLSDVGAKYVLTGKFQTDPLEHRFGRYRQLSGANYHVSVRQILESEKKLRILACLRLKSARSGTFVISELANFIETNCDFEMSKVNRELVDTIVSSEDIDLCQIDSNVTMPIIVYIAGYASMKLCLNKLSCYCCKSVLVQEKALNVDCPEEFSLIERYDRGGLKYPSELCIDIASVCYLAFQIVISERYESDLLQCVSQKSTLIELFKLLVLSDPNMISDEVCGICDTRIMDLCFMLLPCFVNIFLGNYSKNRNNVLEEEKRQKRLRKLSTLTKSKKN